MQTATVISLATHPEFIVLKRCVVLATLLMLASCGAPKPRSQPPLPAAAGAGSNLASADMPLPPAGPGVYAIDPGQSEVRLLVYRAGAMAQLGHNHVITHRSVGGWVQFTGKSRTASFALSLPLAGFVIDNAAARSQEGTDFFEEVPTDAKEGTRRNMLSAALLDGEHFPTVTVISSGITDDGGTMNATLRVRIAGHESVQVVRFQAATSTGQISVSGSIKLRQTSLGLKPFSIMLGALQVQDEMTVKFTLVALRN